mmetsp:Transcript_17767/g.41956  ORF Transcript_17767/g.41956 Transcript_17767/m.41956 type:complete len:255 (-) Transcript_17767:60-824(-)
MKQEMKSEHNGLIELVGGLEKGKWIQLFVDAGTNPRTGEDQAVSFALCLHEKPVGSPLDDAKFDALGPIEKLVHWLTYGPPACILACFLEDAHSNGHNGFRRIVHPWLPKRSDIIHEPGFDVEDVNRVVCRSDWVQMLRKVFISQSTRSFYLSEFSARLVSRPTSEDLYLKPKSEFVGVGHAFYPHRRKRFATKTVPTCKWSDGCIQAEVKGLTPEERQTMRSKLEAAVGDTSVELHDVCEEDCDGDDENEGED